MTTLTDAKQAIADAIVDGITTVSVYFENEAVDASAPYAVFRFAGLTSAQDTLGAVGSREFERVHSLVATIHTSLDAGTSAADGVVEELLGLLEGETVGTDIYFRSGTPQPIGPDGTWFVTVLAIDFWFRERK